MLNADDAETVFAIRALENAAASGTKPIVFWIGAGASKWLGYPLWRELSLQLRKAFFQQVAGFDNRRAEGLLNAEQYQELFQMCRLLDEAKYNRFITDAFTPRPRTTTYTRFIDLLSQINPLYVLTTNVDETLEKNLPSAITVQKEDLSRCVDLLRTGASFVAKLHGSVSSVRSMVFTTDDYTQLVSDHRYIESLRYIFTGSTVVFLAYSVRDSYVIKMLSESAADMQTFGAGPHFVVTNETTSATSLRRIRYITKLNPDHSAAITLLGHVAQIKQSANVYSRIDQDQPHTLEQPPVAPEGVLSGKTAYYISDLLPQDFQEITAKGERGQEIEGAFGLGFTEEEMPFRKSTALHDITVGLICFDYLYFPSSAFGLIHHILGSTLFWELVKGDVIRFIHNVSRLGVIFTRDAVIGDIGNTTTRAKEGNGPITIAEIIRKSFNSVPGRESEAEELFEELEKRTLIYGKADEIALPSLVRSALLMPSISNLLGIGDAILPNQTPRWLRYSYLRLGHLVQTAALCSEYGIQAAKVSFGGTQLASAAFGVQPSECSSDCLASYVSTGIFNADLGWLVHQNPSVINHILWFRNAPEGIAFRLEIQQVLATEEGSKFNAAVNAGLSRTIPIEILQRARDRLLTLMTESRSVATVPAVWGNVLSPDSLTRKWRARSELILTGMCAARGIGKDDPCICGSGEKLRLCCLAPLRR
jgi:hypothetical protein